MKLAPLSNSTTNIEYYEWAGLFTGETFIKIKLGSKDLADFESHSPLLAECQVEVFTSAHQHLPRALNQIQPDSDHKYFIVQKKTPDWFDLTVTNNGKLFPIWPGDQILINKDTGTIYIHLVKG